MVDSSKVEIVDDDILAALREAAAEIARLRARPTWREGVEAAVGATCALHVEGVGDEIDEYNSALGDAVCAIRALKEPEPT